MEFLSEEELTCVSGRMEAVFTVRFAVTGRLRTFRWGAATRGDRTEHPGRPDHPFADEPAGNLDSANSGIVHSVLRDLNEILGRRS